jgi:UDP-2-acetamido-3-amino-2,3-dideoxy-glucuronate N-acetyltransferase
MTKVVAIGAGYWGKNLVRNFAELGALHGICDVDEGRASELADKYGARIYGSLTEIWEDQSVDAVAIAVPAELHYDVADAALRADKHCLVEKPLTLNLEDARRLADLASSRGLILMVGHLLEHHPAVRKLGELIEAGTLGKVHFIYSTRLNFGKVRRAENALWGLGVHDISMILRLLGEEPQSVTCSGGAYLTAGTADTALAALTFPSGARASIFVSWLYPEKEQKLVVVGSERMAVLNDAIPQSKLQLYDAKVQWVSGQPVTSKVEGEPVAYEDIEPLKAECVHFLDAVASGRQPLTDGQDAIRVLRVLTACQASLEQGGAPKRLNEPHFPGCRIHPTAIVDPGAQIGPGTQIWHFSHVLSGSVLGPECRVGQNVVIGPDVTIGRNVKIQNNVSVYKGVTLEDDVFCGPSMVFTNVFNPRAHIPRMKQLRETRVCRGATLGANATVLCGHRIGRYAFIGAGAVVTKDVPDHALVLGNPARIAAWVCLCASKLDFGRGDVAECSDCGRRYRKTGDAVAEDVANDTDA